LTRSSPALADITAKSETARVVLIVQMLADLALPGADNRLLLRPMRRGQQKDPSGRPRLEHATSWRPAISARPTRIPKPSVPSADTERQSG
jgi:hypothetical protein